MLGELKSVLVKTVGMKQTLKAIESGKANRVYLALDVDEYVSSKVKSQCEENNIPIVYVNSMKELGEACNIKVGAATAAILKDDN